MKAYFAFIDETGIYNQNMDERQSTAHPYFINACLLISVEDWCSIRDTINRLKIKYNFDKAREVKWSFIWSLKAHQERGDTVDESKPYYYLRNKKWSELESYVKGVMAEVSKLESANFIFVVKDNKINNQYTKESIFKFHLQEIMQRIHFDMKAIDGICSLFMDEKNRKDDKIIRNIYRDIVLNGDFIKKYSAIRDGISIEISEDSCCGQVVDYALGAFSYHLKNIEHGSDLFKKLIFQKVRRSSNGKIIGYGIIDAPKDDALRFLWNENIKILNEELG